MTSFTGSGWKDSMKKIALYMMMGILVLSTGACKTASTNVKQSAAPNPEMEAALANKPPELRAAYKRLYVEGERNEVLNLMRLGLDAIQLGQIDTANGAFNLAIQGIERVFANSEQALKARSLWNEEGAKIFKGEPYERAMAYYYSGLVNYWKDDVQNARARFLGGVMQDQFAEEEQNRCDIALLYYLAGWTSQVIGGDPYFEKFQFEQLHRVRPDFRIPDPEENVLLIFETGKSPRKLSDGVGHYQLKFFRGKKFKEKRVKYAVDDGAMVDADPIEDVYFQASSRGGRQFDYILEGKAEFKKSTAAVGTATGELGANAMLAASVFQNSADQLQAVGAGLGAVSAVSMIASARAHAEADTRYWNNLPDMVHVSSLKLDPGPHTLAIAYFDLEGNEIPSLRQEMTIEVPESKRLLHWSRSRQQITSK